MKIEPRPHATLRLLEQPLAAVHGSGATASELAARVAKLRGALGRRSFPVGFQWISVNFHGFSWFFNGFEAVLGGI